MKDECPMGGPGTFPGNGLSLDLLAATERRAGNPFRG